MSTAYTFFVTMGGVTTQVYPLNFLSSKLVYEKDDRQPFYRTKYSGSLTFTNVNGANDFTLLEAADTGAKITFEIKRDGTSYWTGYFATSDGEFDYDHYTFEVAPLVDDSYNDILLNAETEYNILSIGTVVTVTATKGIINQSFTRNRWLTGVIDYLANNLKLGVATSYTFFTDNTNPVTLHANRLKYLTIAQKSDIVRPDSTNGATVAYLSWNGLMEILWAMFEVCWEYDSATDTIRVEHQSFWTKSAGLDLTSQPIAKNNSIAFSKEKMPKYEWLKFMEAYHPDFVGLPIWYDSKSVDPNPKTNSVETTIDVTTDLEYIIKNPLEISDDGFVILCNYLSGGQYYVTTAIGDYSDDVRLNVDLSVSNLQNRYWRHNRVLIQGYLNNVLTTFWSAKKTMLQETYAIVCPADNFDPQDEITTELGTNDLGGVKGTVVAAELDPNGCMKLQLAYGPADNTNTGVDDPPKYINVLEQQIGLLTRYTAQLSEATPEEITLSVFIILQDEDGLTCQSGPEDLIIPALSTGASIDIAWCTPGKDPICIGILSPDNSDAEAKGWTVFWDYDDDAHC